MATLDAITAPDISSRSYTTLNAITKSDSTVYSPPLRGIYVGGAGDVAVIAYGNTSAITLSAVPVGTVIPIVVTKVMSTNTSATLLIGLR